MIRLWGKSRFLAGIKIAFVGFVLTLITRSSFWLAPSFTKSKKWLDIYFSGVCPDFTPELDLRGSAFALSVWGELLAIKYGLSASYGTIAKSLENSLSKSKIAAQAVGRAVGANPIAIIVPCHRVLGSDLSLKGYAYGLERKTALLELEKIIYKK